MRPFDKASGAASAQATAPRSLGQGRKDVYRLGIAPIDSVRQRAKSMGMTLRQLDWHANTGCYFQHTTRRVDWAYLALAAEKLGGRIIIQWRDD